MVMLEIITTRKCSHTGFGDHNNQFSGWRVQAFDDDTAGTVLLDGVLVGHHVAVSGSTRLDAYLAELMDESDEHFR